MPFPVPMIWRESTGHVNDCCFCHTPFMKKKLNKNKKSLIEYPNMLSAILPVTHSDDLPIPEPCEVNLLSSDDAASSKESSILNGAHSGMKNKPHLINESEQNDFV